MLNINISCSTGQLKCFVESRISELQKEHQPKLLELETWNSFGACSLRNAHYGWNFWHFNPKASNENGSKTKSLMEIRRFPTQLYTNFPQISKGCELGPFT